jgi:hypothetical protein
MSTAPTPETAFKIKTAADTDIGWLPWPSEFLCENNPQNSFGDRLAASDPERKPRQRHGMRDKAKRRLLQLSGHHQMPGLIPRKAAFNRLGYGRTTWFCSTRGRAGANLNRVRYRSIIGARPVA